MNSQQSLISTDVSLSSNHLSGTACPDINTIRKFVGINSTFSHCMTDAPNYQNQHLSSRTELLASPSGHFFQLCTFKNCKGSSNGAAISLTGSTSLRLDQCSFLSCQTTADYAGCVFMNSDGGSPTLTVTASSFVDAKSAWNAGSVYIMNTFTVSVSGCIFANSTTNMDGGALNRYQNPDENQQTTISDCVFSNCSHTDTTSEWGGGALVLSKISSQLTLHSLHFRNCSSATNRGHDIYFWVNYPTPSDTLFPNCESTSSSPRIYFHNGPNWTIPNPQLTTTLISIAARGISSNTVCIELTTDKTLSGTMMVLVNNLNGLSQTQPPNINRLLSFTFGTSTEPKAVGTCSVTYGKKFLLQSHLDEYVVDIASISNHEVNVPTGFSLPILPCIISASCDLDETGKYAEISLSGRGITPMVCDVTLVEVPDFLFSVTFLPSAQTSTPTLVLVYDSEAPLQYGATYTLETVRNAGQIIRLIGDDPITFTVPSQFERLDGTSVKSYSNKDQEIEVDFSGIFLEGDYTIILSINSTDANNISTTINFSGSKGTLKAILYNFNNPSTVNMTYGTTYSVISVMKGDKPISFASGHSMKSGSYTLSLVNQDDQDDSISIPLTFSSATEGSASASVYPTSTIKFGGSYTVVDVSTTDTVLQTVYFEEGLVVQVDNEPPRIKSTSSRLSGDRLMVNVSIVGLAFPSTMTDIQVTNGEKTWSSTPTWVSSEECWVTFRTSRTENNTALKYSTAYSILTAPSVTNGYYVHQGVTIEVPPAPILTSAATPMNSTTNLGFRITVDGHSLPSSGAYVASFKDVDRTVTINFDADGGRSDWIEIQKDSDFMFRTTYSLVSMVKSENGKEDEHILCEGVEVVTPNGPVLLDVTTSVLDQVDRNKVKMELSVSDISTEEYSLCVVDQSDDTNTLIPLSVSFDSVLVQTAQISFLVYGSGVLEYEHTYRVASMQSQSTKVQLSKTIVFTVPQSPPRITNAQATLNGGKTVVTVTLTGSNLVQKNFNAKVKGCSGEFTSTAISEVTSSSCKVSFSAGQEESSSLLGYGAVYEVISVSGSTDSFVVNPSVSFEVPKAPIVQAIDPKLSINCSHFQLTFTGTNLPETGSYTASLVNPNSFTFQVDFAEKIGTSEWIEAGVDGSLLFNASYTISSLVLSGEHIVMNKTDFKTPEGPTLSSVDADLNSTDPNKVDLKFRGERMVTGDYKAVVVEMGEVPSETNAESVRVEIEVKFGTSLLGTQTVEVYVSNTLKYNTRYEVTGLSKGSLNVSLPSRVTFPTPIQPIRVEHADCALNSSRDGVVVALSGQRLEEGDYLVVLEAFPSTQFSAILSIDGTLTFVVSADSSESVFLKYDQVYQIRSVTLNGSPIIVNPGVEFLVPKAPIVQKIIGTSEWIEAGVDGSLLFNASYTISSLVLSGEHIVMNKTDFKTPEGPTLSSVDADLNSTDPNKVDLKFRGERMVTGDYKAVVVEMGEVPSETNAESVRVEIEVKFGTSLLGTQTVEVYVSNTLKYNTRYEVTGLSKGSLNVSLPSRVTFPTPIQPIRVEHADCALNSSRDGVVVALSGQRLEEGDYLVVLEAFPSTQFSAILSIDGTLTFVVSADSSESVFLKYDQVYQIRSVTLNGSPIIVNPGVEFLVPKAPIVQKIVSQLSTNCSHIQLTFTGTNLPETGSYTASLVNPNSFTFQVDFAEKIGTSEWIEAGVDGSLLFNASYTISSLVLSGEHIVMNKTDFKTPEGPTLSSVDADLNSTDPNKVDLKFRGERMVTGDYKAVVVEMGEVPSETNAESVRVEIEVKFGTSLLGTQTVEVYVSNTLKYNTRYEVTGLSKGSLNVSLPSRVTFPTPIQPIRVEHADCALNSSRDGVVVALSGQRLEEGDYLVVLEAFPSTQFSAILSIDGTLTFVVSADSSESVFLKYDQVYQIRSVTLNGSPIIVNAGVEFLVPDPPIVSDASVSFKTESETVIEIKLIGSHLKLKGQYNVTLDSNDWFVITFENEGSGSSEELGIGWNNTLQYSTTYTVTSIVKVEDDLDRIPCNGPVSFATGQKPHNPSIYVRPEAGDSSRLCGGLSRPCLSVDIAWKIVLGIQFIEPTILIIHTSPLLAPITLKDDMHVVMTNGTTSEPSLTIPSTSSLVDSTMIDCSDSFLELKDVDVHLQSESSAFVFLAATESSIVLRDGSFQGKEIASTSRNEQADTLCLWETGIIRLVKSTTTITNTLFAHLSQGAICMNGGTLKVFTTSFTDNTPNSPSFPSAHRNIRCSEEGSIDVQSLNGGDGTSEKQPHAWISSEDCSLSSPIINVDAPHFIPTLFTNNSTVIFDKAARSYKFHVNGQMLLRCGLTLNVFDRDQTRQNGHNASIECASLEVEKWTETETVFIVTEKSLQNSLDSKLEWRGQFKFGNTQFTDSIRVKMSNRDKIAQSTLQSIPWLVPLVVCVIAAILFFLLFCLCCRRKCQKNEHSKSEEIDEAPIEMKEDVFLDLLDPTNQPSSRNIVHTLPLADNSEKTDFTKAIAQNRSEVVIPKIEFIQVMKCVEDFGLTTVNKQSTLYSRLHSSQTTPKPKTVEFGLKITQGLRRLVLTAQYNQLLTRISSHIIFVDPEDNPLLQLQTDPQNSDFEGTVHSYNRSCPKNGFEGQRWTAPEVLDEDGQVMQNINHQKAAVFSLGLILWEIDTRQVPVRELDAVNAQRVLGTGNGLNMQLVTHDTLRDLISKCLIVDPANRPSLEDIEKELQSISKEMIQQDKDRPDIAYDDHQGPHQFHVGAEGKGRQSLFAPPTRLPSNDTFNLSDTTFH
ncbi:hypothetical protein BLNAU_18757 [Blattamonas nauphoetae]|uniref:Protein kinase domain-containing protein n=1 Tax=Blattamonas nauphoetae TaxID=2049346 RepID=A0ABQ9X3G4_9EUKA|nr:hypothetical protein BLNAU_18757 [Blattamonas nauphoetae]